MNTETTAAVVATVVAFAALYVSWQAERRAAVLARTQMFLELRTTFLDVYQRLPSFDKPASAYTPEERAVAQAYWHQAFDEWYVTNHLDPRHMKKLWNEFYAPAVLAGMRHEGLRTVLFSMIDSEDELGEYRRSFGDAMQKLWESRKSARAAQ